MASNLLETILIVLQFVGSTRGGVCWGSSSNGRCRELLRPNVSKSQCCNNGLDSISWSPDSPSGQLLFQWIVSGGPSTCTNCHRTCTTVKCPSDRKCRMRGGQPRCVCAPDCYPHNHKGELCGTNGLDYKNHCSMLKQICRSGSIVEVDYYGKCQRSCSGVTCDQGKHCVTDQNGLPHCIRCQMNCPPVTTGQTVCGSDGVTYHSLCLLRRAACTTEKTITTAYLGSCRIGTASCSDVQCPSGMICLKHHRTLTPVCTYCNGQCSTETHGSETICGTDNKTYPNWCSLRRTRCRTRFYVETKHNGPCRV